MTGPAPRPPLARRLLIGGVAVVAAVALAAVYVSGGPGGNGAALACAAAGETAARLAPLAAGEVAAFRPASEPQPLSEIAFDGPDGRPMTLAGLSGRTVLLNLWATWCVPCREEMPALDRLEQALGGDAFTVAAVNVDTRASARPEAFLQEIGVASLDHYADPSGRLVIELRQRGLAVGLPTTVLVDPKGCTLGVMSGPAEWDSADGQALIRAALPPA